MSTGTLVLLRHGESEWNAKNLFTGWVDVPLTDKGIAEAERGGRLIAEAGLDTSSSASATPSESPSETSSETPSVSPTESLSESPSASATQ